MVLVYLKTGECLEWPAAVDVTQDEYSLTCVDRHGDALATFANEEVEAFTNDAEVAEIMEEEVCEDLTIVDPPELDNGRFRPANN